MKRVQIFLRQLYKNDVFTSEGCDFIVTGSNDKEGRIESRGPSGFIAWFLPGRLVEIVAK